MIAVKTDALLQEQVLDELRWDSSVDDGDIGVSVAQGLVTLRGSVQSYAAKLAAQEAAHRVAGVLDVANELAVRIGDVHRPNDTQVTQAVRQSLEADVRLDPDQIRLSVSSGWVTLAGTVPSLHQRAEAGWVVSRIAGVTGLSNNLVVSSPPIDTQIVRQALEQAVARRAAHEAQHIDIRVQDGTVTLLGTVDSWAEKRAVLGAVEHAPGVHTVDDQLLIMPYR